MRDPMQRARDMLAAEYERNEMDGEAACLRVGVTASLDEQCAVTVIAALLTREEEVRGWQPITEMGQAIAEAESVVVGWWFSHPLLGTSWETDIDPLNPNATHLAILPPPPAIRADREGVK